MWSNCDYQLFETLSWENLGRLTVYYMIQKFLRKYILNWCQIVMNIIFPKLIVKHTMSLSISTSFTEVEILDWLLLQALQVIVWKTTAIQLKSIIDDGLIVYITRKTKLMRYDQEDSIVSYLTLVSNILETLLKENNSDIIKQYLSMFKEIEDDEGFSDCNSNIISIKALINHHNDSISELANAIYEIIYE